MAPAKRNPEARNFFLNEAHELAPKERGAGGNFKPYVGIDWARRAVHLKSGVARILRESNASSDPTREHHVFAVAQPEPSLFKESSNKQKAKDGKIEQRPSFGGAESRLFERLQMDLLRVSDEGVAIVHADKAFFESLRERTGNLADLGPREQSAWAAIASLAPVNIQLRLDFEWFNELGKSPADFIVELQPVLVSSVEVDQVLRAISETLAAKRAGGLTGSGRDFTGRSWFRGRGTSVGIQSIANSFSSIQAIHPPLYSWPLAAPKRGSRAPSVYSESAPAPVDIMSLPRVAVVDMGVPTQHRQLGPFRLGQFTPPGGAGIPIGDHGAFVASRVVFGHTDDVGRFPAESRRCAVFDANVGDPLFGDGARIDDKLLLAAMTGVKGAAPDVRVFNLSIGDLYPTSGHRAIERSEKLTLTAELDNFAFAYDSIVVVAAGNSARGNVPSEGYPHHVDNPAWALGPLACGFNTLVCGAFVSVLSVTGLAAGMGHPSPLTRVGPGICDAPTPSFSAEGGNVDQTWNAANGLGVPGYSGRGMIEDRVGTSFSAPLLAREAAFALQDLQRYCAPGSHPFAVLVRAYLALTANPPTTDRAVALLSRRTLGFGKADSAGLETPSVGSAVTLWQGIIPSRDEKIRVLWPIPLEWLNAAERPVLRFVLCADPPVNSAATQTWACRNVEAVLHLGPDAPSVRRPNGENSLYPLVAREYDLCRFKRGAKRPAEGDLWMFEIGYREIAAYPPGNAFDAGQRVAVATELVDKGSPAVDPQHAMQILPNASAMTRLSALPTPVHRPITIRVRR